MSPKTRAMIFEIAAVFGLLAAGGQKEFSGTTLAILVISNILLNLSKREFATHAIAEFLVESAKKQAEAPKGEDNGSGTV